MQRWPDHGTQLLVRLLLRLPFSADQLQGADYCSRPHWHTQKTHVKPGRLWYRRSACGEKVKDFINRVKRYLSRWRRPTAAHNLIGHPSWAWEQHIADRNMWNRWRLQALPSLYKGKCISLFVSQQRSVGFGQQIRNTHSVGGRPLHRDLIPSIRIILIKASWNRKAKCLNELNPSVIFRYLKNIIGKEKLYSHHNFIWFSLPKCQRNDQVLYTMPLNCHSHRRIYDPSDHYSTQNISLQIIKKWVSEVWLHLNRNQLKLTFGKRIPLCLQSDLHHIQRCYCEHDQNRIIII